MSRKDGPRRGLAVSPAITQRSRTGRTLPDQEALTCEFVSALEWLDAPGRSLQPVPCGTARPTRQPRTTHQDPDQARANSASQQTIPPFAAGQKRRQASTTSRPRTYRHSALHHEIPGILPFPPSQEAPDQRGNPSDGSSERASRCLGEGHFGVKITPITPTMHITHTTQTRRSEALCDGFEDRDALDMVGHKKQVHTKHVEENRRSADGETDTRSMCTTCAMGATCDL